MAGFSKVVMVGNVCRDPEFRSYESKTGAQEMCNFTLAIGEKYSGKDTSTFIDVALFGRNAEIAKEYVSKGSQILVEGRLNQSSWEDKKSGEKRSKISVSGERLVLLGAPKPKAEASYSSSARRNETDDIPF